MICPGATQCNRNSHSGLTFRWYFLFLSTASSPLVFLFFFFRRDPLVPWGCFLVTHRLEVLLGLMLYQAVGKDGENSRKQVLTQKIMAFCFLSVRTIIKQGRLLCSCERTQGQGQLGKGIEFLLIGNVGLTPVIRQLLENL